MRDRREGFTLIELVIVTAIIGILAAAALPLARWSVKRSKEHELQQALRILRTAIDRYHDAAAAGLIDLPDGASGYPPSLEVLVEGVPLMHEMPSPVPPVADVYAATGSGLTGGLQALTEQQQQAGGGTGFAGSAGLATGLRPRSTGAGGTGQYGASTPGSPSRPGVAASGFGSRLGATGGVRSADSRPTSAFDRPSPFGSGGFGSGFDAGADVEGEGSSDQPLLDAEGNPVLLQFLRRLPVDPMTGKADWGLRCYGEPPEDRLWCGADVFDVYSKSLAKAIDGSSYRDW